MVIDSRYKGKRPPARDGSAHIIVDDKLIIMGGDRYFEKNIFYKYFLIFFFLNVGIL